jgi:hypothetical protein
MSLIGLLVATPDLAAPYSGAGFVGSFRSRERPPQSAACAADPAPFPHQHD